MAEGEQARLVIQLWAAGMTVEGITQTVAGLSEREIRRILTDPESEETP